MSGLRATARHDYLDSVWDVWLEGGTVGLRHVRVVADGKYEAIVAACEMSGMSRRTAEQIAGEA